MAQDKERDSLRPRLIIVPLKDGRTLAEYFTDAGLDWRTLTLDQLNNRASMLARVKKQDLVFLRLQLHTMAVRKVRDFVSEVEWTTYKRTTIRDSEFAVVVPDAYFPDDGVKRPGLHKYSSTWQNPA